MDRSLPFAANLEAIQKEARTLFRDLQQNDVAAVARYRAFEFLDRSSRVRLADAQYVIARHYGFKSWTSLRKYLLLGTE